jgi:hypothetical protein
MSNQHTARLASITSDPNTAVDGAGGGEGGGADTLGAHRMLGTGAVGTDGLHPPQAGAGGEEEEVPEQRFQHYSLRNLCNAL